MTVPTSSVFSSARLRPARQRLARASNFIFIMLMNVYQEGNFHFLPFIHGFSILILIPKYQVSLGNVLVCNDQCLARLALIARVSRLLGRVSLSHWSPSSQLLLATRYTSAPCQDSDEISRYYTSV